MRFPASHSRMWTFLSVRLPGYQYCIASRRIRSSSAAPT